MATRLTISIDGGGGAAAAASGTSSEPSSPRRNSVGATHFPQQSTTLSPLSSPRAGAVSPRLTVVAAAAAAAGSGSGNGGAAAVSPRAAVLTASSSSGSPAAPALRPFTPMDESEKKRQREMWKDLRRASISNSGVRRINKGGLIVKRLDYKGKHV